MNLRIFKTVDELNEELAKYLVEIANTCIANSGRFNFVLTGGSSPKKLYRSLATIYKDKIDWTKVFFFIGDERYVPPSDQNYNGLMAKQNLLDELEIPSDHIFLVDTSLPPPDAAKAYKEKIDEHYGGQKVVFDLVLLGMGDDAHTASIFPGTDLVDNPEKEVAAVWVEKLNAFRISLTAAIINDARHVAFIAYGENKANALKHVLCDVQKNYKLYPAQLIQPVNGTLDWFVDEQAKSLF